MVVHNADTGPRVDGQALPNEGSTLRQSVGGSSVSRQRSTTAG